MPFYYRSHGKEAPNAFVATVRKIYNPLGFYRGYNFPLWIITGLGALAFCASRAMFLDYDGTYKEDKIPIGEWLYQGHGRGRTGMLMHLAAVIPIGFLIPWQFLPVVWHKFMLFHRINGYLLILLLIICNIGAILVGPGALGGTIEVRLLIGVLTISTWGSALMAWVNIKQLQIDQHRAWMLRCWAIAFNIVSLRLIQLAAVEIISRMKSFYATISCARIDSAFSIIQPGMAPLFYPACEDPTAWVAVLADGYPEPTPEGIPRLDMITASAQVTFAMSGFMALLIHLFVVEVYLHLTKAESERLKKVSYERQMERKWGLGWLTAQRLGDVDRPEYEKVARGDDEEVMKPVSIPSSGNQSYAGRGL